MPYGKWVLNLIGWLFSLTSALSVSLDCSSLILISCLFFLSSVLLCLQVSEVEVNGQIEAVCESVFSEMESKAVDALDLPVPGCFRMRSHSYVRAIDQGCSEDDDGPLLPASPPRTTTTVRTIQSSTGQSANTLSFSVVKENSFSYMCALSLNAVREAHT